VKGQRSILFGNLFEKRKKGINKDMMIFTFFLFLSFIFWFLNSLEKEIQAEVRYPVRYVNLPENRVLSEDIPSKLTLLLEGSGYSILKIKLYGSRTPVALDVSDVNYRRVRGSSDLNYYIITSGLVQKLTNQLRSECRITSVQPDTLFFSLDRIISRTVPVFADIELTTDKQFFVKGDIIIEPDSVTITGPKKIIDTTSSVSTRKRKLTGLSETVKKNYPLSVNNRFSISEKKVAITIPVEQFTEAGVTVPVKIINTPDSIDIKIFPDEVSVKCLVAISDYKKINDMPFEIVLDIGKADLNSSEKLPVEIINVPPFVKSLRFTPESVDFLIERIQR